jgi:hypothetical protein
VPGMAGMPTIDRLDGRTAFLRTEHKITDVQVMERPHRYAARKG